MRPTVSRDAKRTREGCQKRPTAPPQSNAPVAYDYDYDYGYDYDYEWE
jgi:hypothetical protein